MNHNNPNYRYANYQSPNGLPNQPSPVHGNGNGNGNAYSNGQQNYNGVPPQAALNYGQNQYTSSAAYNNIYRPPPVPSPQQHQHHVYSPHMVVIPQQPRLPHPSVSSLSPHYNIGPNQVYPPRQHQQQQQPQWQNYQQQPPRPIQHQVPPQYSSHNSATTTPRSVKSHAMVEIPVQRTPQQHVPKIPQKPQSRPSSNPQSRTPLIPQSRPQPQPQHRVQPTQQPVKPAEPTPDYHQLLLALADDYISAAHGMASRVAFHKREDDLEEYHKLIATGLGCMESALLV